MAQQVTNPIRSPSLAPWVKVSYTAASCDVDLRCDWDLAFLWLWRRMAAMALIPPLAWERPYAAGAALKRQKPKPKQKPSSVHTHTRKDL